MALFDSLIKRLAPGRNRRVPQRDTIPYPAMAAWGYSTAAKQPAYKPTPYNLRRFSRTPVARRAINRIKNPIAQMEWEIGPRSDVAENSEIKRQCEVVTNCFSSPNTDDSFHTFIEQVIEDVCCGAGAIELATSGDELRPLWMWPTDGLSIQIFPKWNGSAAEPRYVQTKGGIAGYGNGTDGVPLRNDELIYIRPNPATDTPFGHGPLEIAFLSISRQLGAADFAGKVASNALPAFGINLAGADPATVAAFRSYWQNQVEGQGQAPIWGREAQVGQDGKVVGDGVVKLYPTGDDALFLQYQEFLKREIACAFNISPLALNVERDVNRNTAEVMTDMDWDDAIVPMAHMIASHLNREAIRSRLGFTQVEFRWKGLQRDDELAAAQIDQILYDINSITPDQILEKRGLPPSVGLWGKLYSADVEIAKQAARGTAEIDDPNLPPVRPAAKPNPKPAPEPEKSKGAK